MTSLNVDLTRGIYNMGTEMEYMRWFRARFSRQSGGKIKRQKPPGLCWCEQACE